MSITFRDAGAGARRAGATVGGAMGFGLALVSVAMLLPTGGAAGALVVLAVVALVLAVPLGWLFAPRALAPGTRNALTAAAGATALAVPLGAVLIGLAMVVGSLGGDAGWNDGTLAGAVAWALGGLLVVEVAGLFLFGLPLACATFVVAGVWVVLLRKLAPALGVSLPGPAAPARLVARTDVLGDDPREPPQLRSLG